MIKRLAKHGNSLAFVVEKPLLDLLGADAETPFEITTDGHALVLTPMQNPKRKRAFDAALAKTNRKYKRTLKRLAE